MSNFPTPTDKMYCLICSSDLTIVGPAPSDQFSSTKERFQLLSIIDKHLYIIFVLRKVLKIPVKKLEIYLKKCPEIENWFELCCNCSELIDKSKNAYNSILEAIQEFKTLQEEIVETIKSSGRIDFGELKEETDGNNYIINSSREYVLRNKYGNFFDPFIIGDDLARRKVSTSSSSTLIVHPGEEQGQNNNETDSVPLIQSIYVPDSGINVDINQFPSENCRERVSGNRKILKIEQLVLKDHLDVENHVQYVDENDETENFSAEGTTLVGGIESDSDNEIAFRGNRSMAKASQEDDDDEWTPQIPNGSLSQIVRNNPKLSPITKRRQMDPHPQSQHKCEVCGNGYKSELSLQQHILLHVNAKSKPFRCRVCGRGFPRKDYLNYHLRQEHTIAKVGVSKCPEKNCGATFVTSKLLEHHMKEHGNSPKLKCRFCGEKFYLRYAKFRHENLHSKGTPIPKPSSSSPLPSSPSKTVRTKKRKRQNVKSESNPVCSKGMTFGQVIKRKFSSHKMKTWLPCKVCGNKFPTMPSVQRHMAEIHNIMSAAVRKCEVKGCGKFISGGAHKFKIHMAKHRGMADYKCEICGWDFYYKHHYTRHIETHKRRQENVLRRGPARKINNVKPEG